MGVGTADWRPPLLECPLHSRNFLNRARIGKIHCHYWRGRDARGSGVVERFRAKMVGPIARRHSDRARTFLVLFSHRYLHCSERCLEFAFFALLNFPALTLQLPQRFTKTTR